MDYFDHSFPRGEMCGISQLDKNFSWRKGFVYCFTGYPGSGKSELLAWLSVMRAMSKNIKVAMYSPESDEIELVDHLCRLFLGKNTNKEFKDQCDKDEYNDALDWVDDHYKFISYESLPSVKDLLNDYQLLTDVEMFITDPFNYVAEGSMDDGKGISRYLKTALSHMKTFARRNKVLNVIVEHPKQPQPNKDGDYPRVNQYMLYGGSMWNNKMDCIVGVTSNFTEKTTIFEVLKMKSQRYNGIPGEVELDYDIKTGRYKGKEIPLR